MKHRSLILLPLLAAAGVAAACGGVASPQGWAPPAATEDLFLVNIGDGDMLALDPDSLSLVWEFPRTTNEQNEDNANPDGLYGRGVFDDEFAYIGAYNGDLFKIHLSTGLTAFEPLDLGDPIIADLAMDGGTIFAATGGGSIYALQSDDLSEVWPEPFETDDRVWAAPLVEDGALYVASMDHKVYKLDPETGTEIWEEPFEADGALAMDPIIVDGKLLAGSFDRHLYVIDPETGDAERSVELDDWVWGRPVVSETQVSVVYVADLSGHVWSVDINSGEFLWDSPYSAGEHLRGAGHLAGDTLVYADTGGTVHFINAADGTQASAPVVAREDGEEDFFSDLTEINDVIYAIGESGRLYEIDAEAFTVTLVPLPESES